jgi:hypothetical protein
MKSSARTSIALILAVAIIVPSPLAMACGPFLPSPSSPAPRDLTNFPRTRAATFNFSSRRTGIARCSSRIGT